MTASCVFLAANDVRRVIAGIAQPVIGRRRMRFLARQEAARPSLCSVDDASMRGRDVQRNQSGIRVEARMASGELTTPARSRLRAVRRDQATLRQQPPQRPSDPTEPSNDGWRPCALGLSRAAQSAGIFRC